MDLRRVEGFASRHHGVVTLAAAQQAGVSLSSWYRAHDHAVLERLYPGVSRIVGSPATRHQQVTAAVLAVGPDAMASHRTAAELWGIPRPAGEPIDVIVSRRARSSALGSHIRLHRPRDHRDLVPVNRWGIPTTNAVRTLCDLGAVDRAGVTGAVGHVLSTRLATWAALDRGIARHAGYGRHGVVAFREALQTWLLDGKPADSVLELAMRKLLRTYGLPPVEFHPKICGYETDFRIIGTRILIECDGWTTHGLDRKQFERDRERDRVHSAAGFVTMRFTYGDIVRSPAATARDIRRELQRWAPELLIA